MSSTRVVAFRPAARVGVIASSLALLAMLWAPNPALAATTIGAPANDPITAVCSLSVDAVQASTDSSTSYAVPFDGFITSWTSQTAGLTGMVGLEVWHFVSAADPVTNTPAIYQLVGATAPVLQDGATNVLAAPGLAVHAGDLLGMRMEGLIACGNNLTGSPLDFWLNAMTTTPAPGVNQAFTVLSAGRLNISATVGAVTPPPPPPPPPPTCGDSSGSSNEGDSSGSSNQNDECDQSDKHQNDNNGHHNDKEKADKEKADKGSDHSANPTPDEASSARTDERKDS